MTSQCCPCHCGWVFFVERYFLTSVFSLTWLILPRWKQLHQHNPEGQGEQLGWGTNWEILQLVSLPKQTHCVPTPSAHGDHALKKKKRNKQNPHDTGDESQAAEHVVEDNYPESGPVVRFLRDKLLAWASVSEERLLRWDMQQRACFPSFGVRWHERGTFPVVCCSL